MKKLILVLATMASVTTIKAQENSILLYGNANFSFGNSDDGKGNIGKGRTCNLLLGVGYQINDNVTLGLLGLYGTNATEVEAAGIITSKTIFNSYGAGAFARYTHKLSSIFSVWTQLSAAYMTDNGKIRNFPSTNFTSVGGSNTFQAEFVPAIAINVQRGLALNFNFGSLVYNRSRRDAGGSNSSLLFTFGQQFGIGITKNILCGKNKHAEPGMDTRRMKDMKDDE